MFFIYSKSSFSLELIFFLIPSTSNIQDENKSEKGLAELYEVSIFSEGSFAYFSLLVMNKFIL